MTGENEISELLLSPGTSIRAAAGRIQEVRTKILLICDGDRRLLGTLTDGDIRRAVSSGDDLDAGVETIMNRSPKVAGADESAHVVRARMQALLIRQMPRVDRRGRVTGMVQLDVSGVRRPRDSAVVLMAGGRGNRLRPLTETLPKPLLAIGDKPLIEHQLEMLIEHGFRRFLISVNYLGHLIEEHLGDGARFGVDISYVREDAPLGTCGALSLIPPQDRPMLVVNGDILTKADFSAMLGYFHETEAVATMGVREHQYTVPYGCVTMDGDSICAMEEKPTFRHLVNAGIYVLRPEALGHIPSGEPFDMPDLFERLIGARRPTNTFLIREEWIDIGRREDLSWAQRVFSMQDRRD